MWKLNKKAVKASKGQLTCPSWPQLQSKAWIGTKALAGGNKGKQGKGERVRGCGGWISFLNKTIVIDVARI